MVPRAPEDPPRLRVPSLFGSQCLQVPGAPYVLCLEQLLLAYCCHELLKIERFEICDVLEVAGPVCL